MKIEKTKTAVKLAALVLGAASIVCPDPAARAQTAPAKTDGHKSHEIDVPATKEWVDTNLNRRGGGEDL